MKKLLCLLTFAIGLMPLASKAQSTTTNGPKLEMNEMSVVWILEDNSDYLRLATVELSPRGNYDNIFINKYNKQTQTNTIQEIDEDFEGRFVFLTDDGMINVVQEYMNKKTKSLEYRKASFPKDSKVPKKLEFVPFYSIPLDGMSDAFVKAAYSEDMSKFVIYTVLKTGNWKKPTHHVDVAVFDAEGTLLWHQFQQSNDWFHAEDFLFANDGTVYLADNGHYLNKYAGVKDYLIISVFTEQGVESQKITPECENYSCKKVLLPNGEMRLVGVGENADGGGYSVLTYSVSSNGQVDYTKSDISLSSEMDGITYDDRISEKEGGFTPYIFSVRRFSNGKLYLTGEMNRIVDVGYYDGMPTKMGNIQYTVEYPLYGRQSHNMFYAILTEDGELVDSKEFPRATVTASELGDREATKVNPVIVFEYDGDAYLIYNEHRGNILGNDSQWKTLYYNRPDQCSVVLSKIESNGELSSTILYNAKTHSMEPRYIANQSTHEYFFKLLCLAEDGFYYFLRRDGEFRLEKIEF